MQVLTNPHMLLVTLLLCNSAAMEVPSLFSMNSRRCSASLPTCLPPMFYRWYHLAVAHYMDTKTLVTGQCWCLCIRQRSTPLTWSKRAASPSRDAGVIPAGAPDLH